MPKLAEPLMDIRNTGKVLNRKVAKSHFVLVLVLDTSFALVQLSRDSRLHSKNNTDELSLLVSSAFSVLKQESTEPQFSLFLSTATSYWDIHFFTTNLLQKTMVSSRENL